LKKSKNHRDAVLAFFFLSSWPFYFCHPGLFIFVILSEAKDLAPRPEKVLFWGPVGMRTRILRSLRFPQNDKGGVISSG